MPSQPIAEYALLSDCRSAALVSRDGTVDWLCFPRFDSPAVFAGLLDDDGGYWSLRPVGEASIQRRYLDATMVLQTRPTRRSLVSRSWSMPRQSDATNGVTTWRLRCNTRPSHLGADQAGGLQPNCYDKRAI